MTKVFITSDVHFNHLRILQYCPHRGGPETNWDKVALMNELIIKNWNSVVFPDDEVYILGDVAMGQIEKAPALISRLNGTKYLVKGNHDKTLTKEQPDGSRYSDGLFEWVKEVHEMSFAVDGKKHMLFMSHYPHASWNGMNKGAIMLHGHLHGGKCEVTGRIMDVGMDTNNLSPYTLDEVVRKMLTVNVIRDHHD
jgi:calcineurin-like phosphoesterase family protein